MKKKLIISISITILLFITLSSKLLAQVTIGSLTPPAGGALLQLKENDNITSGNSSKGLLLPRVELTDINNLFPMFSSDTNYISDTTYKSEKDEANVGLVVYCISASNGFSKGLYVWNGKQWVSLDGSNNNNSGNDSDLAQYTDQDGNKFYATRFNGKDSEGKDVDAGIWMLENLRATKFDDTRTGDDAGQPLPDLTSSPKYTYLLEDPAWAYPANTGQSILLSTFYDLNYSKNLPIGLLYNWYAATGNMNDSEGVKKIQGICPKGWHIPSENEADVLDIVFANESELYSSNTDESNVSRTIKAPQQLYISETQKTGTATGGLSFPFNKGGFYILLNGLQASGNGWNFGNEAHFWTSTEQTGSGNVYTRQVDMSTHPITGTQGKAEYFSIRCKKDN